MNVPYLAQYDLLLRDIYIFCAQSSHNNIHPDYENLRGITIKAPITGRKDTSNEAKKEKEHKS